MPRKTPYSVKQKKKQLQDKRIRKRTSGQQHGGATNEQAGLYGDAIASSSDDEQTSSEKMAKIHQKTKPDKSTYDPDRYKLRFLRDPPAELERCKRLAQQRPLQTIPECDLEVDLTNVYDVDNVLDMPKRPTWHYSFTKQQLDDREETYFKDYLKNIFENHPVKQLSYFEMNLETWRQLWRVLEMSDIVLLITDIRHPVLHFSPALYDYVINDLKKHLILILNKIDLAPPSLVVAWQHYFKERFPKVHIVLFTSFPKDLETVKSDNRHVLHRKKRRGNFSAVGPKSLLEACQNIVKDEVNLSSWEEKMDRDILDIDSGSDTNNFDDILTTIETADSVVQEHVQFKDGILTIGSCGYPNVGKSSLINGLVGKKVVSTSRTPGHTKHFQTIFLTSTVKLCDSPGLVFPSFIPKPLQILSGLYPIAQVQEPYTAVGYLAERVPIIDVLRIKHPEGEEQRWTAWDICDAWAEKRGFKTAKAARLDTYRAANQILRFAVEGRLCLCLRPPGYTDHKDVWTQHNDTANILEIQDLHNSHQEDTNLDSLSDEELSDPEDIENEDMTAGACDNSINVRTANMFAALDDAE